MWFDARTAKLLTPGQHLLVQGCDGLRLVASAAKKTWTYRYKSADGRMKQIAIGHWPATQVQAAVVQWQTLREQRAAGLDPAAQRKQERKQAKAKPSAKSAGTVQAVAESYAAELQNLRRTPSAVAAKNSIAAFLVRHPELAQQPAASLSRAQAFAAIDAIRVTPTAAAKLRSLLGAAWDHAIDSGAIAGDAVNWWRLVHKGKLKSKGKIMGGQHVGPKRRVLSGAEVGQLLRWLPEMSDNAADGVIMYLWTGLRGAEIFGMQPQHVRQEADGWWWTIPKASTKNADHPHAADLRVPLVGRALEVVQRRLSELAENDGTLWVNDVGRPYTQKAFSTYIYHLMPYSDKAQARKSEGLVSPVQDWTPHHLRRTARTMLSELGCPREVAEAIIGHLPPIIEATYNAYSYDRERRHWLTQLAHRLESLAGDPCQTPWGAEAQTPGA